MIVVYEKISSEEIRKTAKEAVEKITAWFASNPKRRVCRTSLRYGKIISVKRKTIKEQIWSAAEEAIK